MIATFVNRIDSLMLADHTCPPSEIPCFIHGASQFYLARFVLEGPPRLAFSPA
jgi:hypothetical protein